MAIENFVRSLGPDVREAHEEIRSYPKYVEPPAFSPVETNGTVEWINYTINVSIGYNDNSNLNITQRWEYDQTKPTKTTHTITNNYKTDISNLSIEYVLDMPKNRRYIIYPNKIDFIDYEFRFNDLIDTGFSTTPSLDAEGYEGRNTLSIGVTKGLRILGSGESITYDPTWSDWKSPTSFTISNKLYRV